MTLEWSTGRTPARPVPDSLHIGDLKLPKIRRMPADAAVYDPESEQTLPALAINLARSPARWEKISSSVTRSGLALQRIAAVEGASVPREQRPDLDAARFRQKHGRTVLDGEYGCYLSHLAALRTVVDEGYPIAIIAEDDIGFSAGLGRRVASIFQARPDMDLLKLVNHRISGFVSHGRSALGDEFGRCLHGPQGSAACYAVSQRGAEKLVHALSTMWLPYDIAFERGWATGASTYTTRLPLVAFEGLRNQTTIATREQYRAVKLPKSRQILTALFRGADYSARALYAVNRR